MWEHFGLAFENDYPANMNGTSWSLVGQSQEKPSELVNTNKIRRTYCLVRLLRLLRLLRILRILRVKISFQICSRRSTRTNSPTTFNVDFNLFDEFHLPTGTASANYFVLLFLRVAEQNKFLDFLLLCLVLFIFYLDNPQYSRIYCNFHGVV